MLTVKTSEEAQELIRKKFNGLKRESESIEITKAIGRILAQNIVADTYIPDFNRSTVDGYAVKAKDVFGCSETMPARLKYKGEVMMGNAATLTVEEGECVYVPTGGEIPEGADTMVMIEVVENYNDGYRVVLKPSAPSDNIIFRGDDVIPGKLLFKEGHRIKPSDIGALAALGFTKVLVERKIKIGIISTGDEIVDIKEQPKYGELRDVNGPLLMAAINNIGAEAIHYGIVKDNEVVLLQVVKEAVTTCDMVLISGGSSVGVRDATSCVLEQLEDSEIFIHGIATKPGKPTIVASVGGKPVFGLPGHPVSTFFIYMLFVRPLIYKLQKKVFGIKSVEGILTSSLPSNHEREQCIPVKLIQKEEEYEAVPIRMRSSLITLLVEAQGYVKVPKASEGINTGSKVVIYKF